MDKLTKKHQLPITRFGIDWMDLSVAPHSSSACKVELVGMKGPNNFFTIFLPKKPLQEPERSREGTHVVACVCVCVCMCVLVHVSVHVCVCVCVCVCVQMLVR